MTHLGKGRNYLIKEKKTLIKLNYNRNSRS